MTFKDLEKWEQEGIIDSLKPGENPYIEYTKDDIIVHLKNGLIDKKRLPMLIAGGVLGVFPGFFAANYISDSVLSKLFAVFLLILGVRELYSANAVISSFSRHKIPPNPQAASTCTNWAGSFKRELGGMISFLVPGQ